MIFTDCCLLPFAALSTHRLKYLGLFHMASAVLTVLNSDILPHVSTGAGTRRLPILHVVNTCDVAFWAFHAIPWILNVQRRSGSVASRLAPGWTPWLRWADSETGHGRYHKSRSWESDSHWNSRSICCFWRTVAVWSEPILPLSATNGLQSYSGIIPDL